VTVVEVVMPRLSDSMEEGTVLRWLKRVGDQVEVGEELVEIETDKANMAYEADAGGTVLELLAAEGDTLAVGKAIAVIGEPGERPAPAAADGADGGSREKVSPLARRIAREAGVDLKVLEGSGPGGRVVKRDVEAAIAAARPAPSAERSADAVETAKGEAEPVELTKLQQAVARRMAESKATAPHFYLQATVDMSAAVAARARLRRSFPDAGVAPSINDMVVKACGLALREYPRVNGAYVDGRFELYSRINVGIAVAAEGALVVPTVFDADRKGLAEIAGDSRRLAARVRDRSITPPELAGGTFTVSNLGMYGMTAFQAVVNPGQAAILAVGEVAEVAVAKDGSIAPGWQMEVSLSCDHRILYGAEGAEFLARVRALLEEPLALAL
jgi:pyruvate dehydrogenase E2 component (dihydrolipoamide acetyltransferase)